MVHNYVCCVPLFCDTRESIAQECPAMPWGFYEGNWLCGFVGFSKRSKCIVFLSHRNSSSFILIVIVLLWFACRQFLFMLFIVIWYSVNRWRPMVNLGFGGATILLVWSLGLQALFYSWTFFPLGGHRNHPTQAVYQVLQFKFQVSISSAKLSARHHFDLKATAFTVKPRPQMLKTCFHGFP